MTTEEEILIYDALASMEKYAAHLCKHINANGCYEDKRKYKDGLYAPCIKLQMVLGTEAINRGESRHADNQAMADAYFDNIEA